MKNQEFLFVYGTLRKGSNHSTKLFMEKHCDFIAEATFNGKMYDLGDYPGTVFSNDPNDCVYGEVYALNNHGGDLLKYLDKFEGCDRIVPLFRREFVEVSLVNGPKINAWIYLYNRSLKGYKEISSGDYIEYLEYLIFEI